MSSMSTDQHIKRIEQMVATVSTDRRDVWPAKLSGYTKGESLASGEFGTVRYAESRDPTFGFDGLEVRRCVIKTVYLRRRLDSILHRPTATSIEYEDGGEHEGLKMLRFYRRTVMELYVLNRCRHQNIMHSHAVFLADGDLNIVLPRLYCLRDLIHAYRTRKSSEPIPVKIIAMVLRQLCFALDYLQRVGIMHRDVHQKNVFMTRAGTVKLGHFGQSKAILSKVDASDCKTPVGKEESMCFEKLHNLYEAKLDNCLPYSYPADVWSLGVLVLAMVSYFPDETSHKLRKDFAVSMHNEKMPFVWFIVDMLQLRSRLVKSGGEDLKLFVSDYLLSVSPEERATAASILQTPQMLKWCSKSVDEDKAYIRKHFIDEVDFANQYKLENTAANYDHLESKDIPAEFYWSDTWKKLEEQEFILKLHFRVEGGAGRADVKEHRFKLSSAEPLFGILYGYVISGDLELVDIIPLDSELREAVYELMSKMDHREATDSIKETKTLPIPSAPSKSDRLEVEIAIAPVKCHRLFSSP